MVGDWHILQIELTVGRAQGAHTQYHREKGYQGRDAPLRVRMHIREFDLELGSKECKCILHRYFLFSADESGPTHTVYHLAKMRGKKTKKQPCHA